MPNPIAKVSSTESAWRMREALVFVRALSRHLDPVAYHVALTGSVLTRGRSTHDLDVVLYPRSTEAPLGLEKVFAALEGFGMKRTFSRETVARAWRFGGSQDEKHVEVWRTRDGKRVDLFFLA